MACDVALKKRIETVLEKHKKDKLLLKEMADLMKDELNALMVEEMSLQSLIRLQNENTACADTSPQPSTSERVADQPNILSSLQEELNLKIINFGNLKDQNLAMQQEDIEEEEEDDDDDDDEFASVEIDFGSNSSDTDTTCETRE